MVGRVENLARLGQLGSPFAGLAERSGFSVREYEVAAASGQLGGIVRASTSPRTGVAPSTDRGWKVGIG
jgi:hypothetical protein